MVPPHPSPASPPCRRIALLGLPNTGKSTLFNRLTGGQAHVANWPGLTVDLQRGALPAAAGGRPCELVDLPGIHGLGEASEDEAIVRRFLADSRPDLLLVVLNATQVAGQLRLVLQLQTLGLPLLVVLNMHDEARRLGVRIDAEALGRQLGAPVLAVSARTGEGIGALRQALRDRPPDPLPSPPADEEALEARRRRLLEACVRIPPGLCDPASRRLDALLLDPLLGPPLFLAVVLASFTAVYALAVPLQDGLAWLFDAVRDRLLLPLLAASPLPPLLQDFLVNGVWLGVATVSSFLPLIFLFYLCFAALEDSGYLPRAAFLMDGLMQLLGLDGRTFVLQVMALGCNVPAILGTRVIRDTPTRLLAMLVIPFSLCQARLTVFAFLAGVFFPRPWWAAPLVLFVYYLLSLLAAMLTAVLFRHAFAGDEPFLLELPPYRLPLPAVMLRRAWRQTRRFMVTTRGFIVVGAAAVWLLTAVPLPTGGSAGPGPTTAEAIGRGLQPLLGPIGMNPALTVSLFFGFIAKEILLGAMAVIHHSGEAGLGPVLRQAITPLQALSFMTFTLLYTPCLSTVAAQRRESGSLPFVLLSLGWSLGLAWGAAFLVFQGGAVLQRAFPVS